jgi:hypothetical protein
MASDYTDEDLFTRYYAATLDARQAAGMVAEHRALYPLPDPARGGDWTGTTPADRERAVLEAIKRAATTADEVEKQALIDHALGGARVREAAAVKAGR